MKKIIALALSLVIVASFATTAFAATNLDGNGFSASSDTNIPQNCTYIVTFSLQLANGNVAVIGRYYETEEVPESYWVCEGDVNYMLATAVPGMTLYNAPENLVIRIEPTKAHGELGEYVLVESNPRIILVKETGEAAYYVKSVAAAQTSAPEEIPDTNEAPNGLSDEFIKIVDMLVRIMEMFKNLYVAENPAE